MTFSHSRRCPFAFGLGRKPTGRATIERDVMDAKWFTRDVAELRLWRGAGVVVWSSIATFVAVRRGRRASRARSPP